MRKFVLVLAMAAIAASAMAAPSFTLTHEGSNVIRLDYNTNGTDLISGMGIQLQTTSGTISVVNNYATDSNDDYRIFPGQIVISGNSVDYNTPVYSGLNTNTVVLEFGALYKRGAETAPAQQGMLCKFTVSGASGSSYTVNLTTNTQQGGVVMENYTAYTDITASVTVTLAAPLAVTAISPNNGLFGTTVPVTITGTGFVAGATAKITQSGSSDILGTSLVVVNDTTITCDLVLPKLTRPDGWNVVVANTTGSPVTLANGFTVAECFKSTSAAYATWVTWGKPDCWCSQRHCRGDANLAKKTYWVQGDDLNVLKSAFNKNDATLAGILGGICADFNLAKKTYRVQGDDLNILKAYFNKNDASAPICPTDNVNAWKN